MSLLILQTFFPGALKRKYIFAFLLFFLTDAAHAQVATLRLNSDLVIHPTQIANMFALNANRINKAATWDWPELRFESPYKTQWSGVTARGPFSLNVHTDELNAQELWFEFYWANPIITVNQFNIHDTVVRDYGGVQVIINLDGNCRGLDWKVNQGYYKVRGRLAWGIVNQQIVVQWKEFQFLKNQSSGASVTNLGACEGPPEIQEALKANIASVTGDQAIMEDLLKRGMLSWMNKSLGELSTQLMQTRQSQMKENLSVSWEPSVLVTLPGGMIRVPGYLYFRKTGVSNYPYIVDRTLPEADYETVTQSGYILPKNAFESLNEFLYSTGDLKKRYPSTDIKGFTDLMNNRSNQSYVWPDLQKFSTSALFYFDLQASSVPKLSGIANGSTQNGGGVAFNAEVPILINQLAPAGNQYLPYVDFTSTVNGIFRASVKSSQLVLQLQTSKVPLTAKFRSEYKEYRSVNEKIDTTRLGTAGKDFINGKTYNMNLPVWDLGPSMNMVYGDLRLFKESIILPLEIK